MALDNYGNSLNNEETLVGELDKAIGWFKTESNFVAQEAIKKLDENQLTWFIEKSFKNGNNEWLTYSEMRQNSFYGFMVQSAIDLLSDKLKSDGGGDKYGKNWHIDKNGKTLDEWIKNYGWIDNKYWPWTRKVVEIVQNILKINPDWAAWPQFFAKVCSVLKWEGNVWEFKVKWYDNNDNKYKYTFNKDNSINISEITNTSTGSEWSSESEWSSKPLDNKVYNNLKSSINLPDYARFSFSNNPYISIDVWTKDTTSGTWQYNKVYWTLEINIKDYVKDGTINNEWLLKKLEPLYNKWRENNDIQLSKTDLMSKINQNPYYTFDDLWFKGKKDDVYYKSFFDYFSDKWMKIDTYRTPPTYKDDKLVFDLDPKWVWNCPNYFKKIEIEEKNLIDNDRKYSFEKFKEQLALKIEEIIKNHFIA